MSYLSGIAKEIQAEVPAELVPDEDAGFLFLIYAVLMLAKGSSVTPEDVHNAWAAWMTHQGKRHDSLVPFEDLAASTKAEDDPFVAAIRHVAERRGSTHAR